MLDVATIDKRLALMRTDPSPGVSWDEQCDGSACALVLFVGPSPGGRLQRDRQPRRTQCNPAMWDQVYDEPLSWSRGFKTSFKPLVESLFCRGFAEAGKLIARVNMDWTRNPESKNVPARYMWQGRHSVLHAIQAARPHLVVPMDVKTYHVLELAMYEAGVNISSVQIHHFRVRISEGSRVRHHKGLHAFKAHWQDGHDFVVIKAPQHPARMYTSTYGARCGSAIREAAIQIAANQSVSVVTD